MFDMNSLLATAVGTTDPPPDPSDIAMNVLQRLKRESGDVDLYKGLICEEEPRYQFLYPITLSNDELTIEFIKSHIMIPQRGDLARMTYKSADKSSSVEITVNNILYTSENQPPKKMNIIETVTLYTKQFSTVRVTFIPQSIHNEVLSAHDTCEEILHPKTIPLKEYRTYSPQHAAAVLEQSMASLLTEVSAGEASEAFHDFFFHLSQVNSKFKVQLERYYHAEALRFQKNNISSPTAFLCAEWAYQQVRIIQNQFLLSFMATTNHGESSMFQFSNLYQPLEDIITSEAYSSIMLILTHQSLSQETIYRSKLKEMQLHPLTHQPIEILPSFRRLALHEAAAELKALESERGRTPLQKLICLKKTFVALESYLLEMSPPTKVAPQPPNQAKSFVNRFTTAKRKRTITELEHSVPEYRRLAFEQWMTRKRHVMQLLLLLLIYHSPPNLLAHLEFILFHTINDEKYASLRLYYHMFRESITQLLQTTPRSKHRSESSVETPDIRYHIYIWGIVDRQVESFPMLCSSLEGKQVVSLKSGDKHMIALAKGGNVLTFGEGSEGQLGHGNELETSEFVEVKLLTNLSVCSIGAGGSHSAVITRSGNLFCWGGNLWGQIGIGFSCESIPIPKQVEFSGPGSHVVMKISCAHNLALMNDGRVWSWGMGANGRLGHGNLYDLSTPRRINTLQNIHITKISCGWSHSLCISNSGEVFSFGHGSDGQLGHGNWDDVSEPRKIDFHFGPIRDCSAFNHNLIASSLGLFTWGWGEHGELGLGELKSQSSPRLVEVEGHEIVTVSCGAFHSAATTTDGFVLTWGLGANGQLGHGDTNSQLTPFALNYLYNHHIVEVSCGFSYTVAVQAAAEKTEYQIVK